MPKATLEPTVAGNRTTVSDKWWENSDRRAVESTHKVLQTINFSLGNFDDDKRTFRAIASTSTVDRQGDTINQDGWDLTYFKSNPVIPWAHDYYSLPVARAIEVGVADGVLQFTYQAPPKGINEFADTVWEMYRNQFLFAFSVGFIPKKADGGDLDFSDYNWDGNDFEAAELLEISAVVVPANPQALALAYKNGTINERQAKQLIAKTQSALKNLEEALETETKISKDAMITVEMLESVVEKAVTSVMEKLTNTSSISGEINPKSLTQDNNNVENATMNKKTVEQKVDGMNSVTAVKDSMGEVCSVLSSHADALDAHAKTMTTHAQTIREKADTLKSAIKSLTSILDDQRENTDEDANESGNDGMGEGSDLDDRADAGPGGKSVKGAKTKDASEDGEAVADESADGTDTAAEDESTENSEGVDAAAETADAEDTSSDESATEDETDDKTAEDDVKSEDETPTDGADQSDELSDEDEVDPENLTEEQAKAIIDHVNKELSK